MELTDSVISALPETDQPISIFMDLSKAFDTLNHTTLLYLPPYMLRARYCSLVQSHLSYAVLTWVFMRSSGEITKRLICIISRSNYNAHSEPLLKQLELLNVPDLLELIVFNFYAKYLHGSLPRFFYSLNIATQGTQHSHDDTRQRDQLSTDRSRIILTDNRIRMFIPTLVNSILLDLLHKITTHSIQGFSFHIKRYLINRYRDIYPNTNSMLVNTNFGVLSLSTRRRLLATP